MIKFSMEGEGSQIAVSVPLFLKKLWKMVNDKEAEDIIGWNSAGDGFIIYDQLQFITKLLPQYFKHNNMASFIRQLNFYDFHKIAGIDKDEVHFSHNCFLKDLPETLIFIKRKCTSVKSKLANNVKEEELMDLLNGVKDLKTKHALVDNELKLLKQENAALWSEINNLRVKHSKQTKIINKIIHFLISYIHSQNSLLKRNGPIAKKNNQKNLKTGPTILEIGYHNHSTELPKQAKQNSYAVPESPGAIIYNIEASDISDEQPAVERSLDEFINNVTTTSIQDNIPSSKKTMKTNILENLKVDTVQNPKTNSWQNLKRNRKINSTSLKKDHTVISPVINTDVINSVTNVSTLVNPVPNTDRLANPKVKTMQNSVTDANSWPNPVTNTVTNVDTLVDPVANNNTVTNIVENAAATTLTQPNDVEKANENLGLFFFNGESPSRPLKNPSKYEMIMGNPKEHLGLYLNNTQMELLSLQDMLNNLSSAELSNFCNLIETTEPDNLREATGGDLGNMGEIVKNKQIENLLTDPNEDLTQDMLVDEYAHLPMECNSLDEIANDNNNFGSEVLTGETIPEVLVDEYFNPEF